MPSTSQLALDAAGVVPVVLADALRVVLLTEAIARGWCRGRGGWRHRRLRRAGCEWADGTAPRSRPSDVQTTSDAKRIMSLWENSMALLARPDAHAP